MYVWDDLHLSNVIYSCCCRGTCIPKYSRLVICPTLAIIIVLNSDLLHLLCEGKLADQGKCCRADDSQIFKKNLILRNIFKLCFPMWKCICASISLCPSWCLHGSTRIFSFLCSETWQISSLFLACTTTWANSSWEQGISKLDHVLTLTFLLLVQPT